MAERINHSYEVSHENNHEVKKHAEAVREAAERQAEASRHEHAESISEIRDRIEKASKSKHEQADRQKESEKKESEQPELASKELKDLAYRRTLRRVQNKLPAPARAFSKVIHTPAVDVASEFAGKTIARPSGVLAGGIFAFLGSSVFLWTTKHYGYEYNYLLFALLFAGGFVFGLLVEILFRLAKRRR